MHPLVRDLYKRVILVGRDYPHPEGLEYVRRTWKAALRNPAHCPSWYDQQQQDNNSNDGNTAESIEDRKEKEIRIAVGKGRQMIREMEGVIQLKKYRAMRRRYGEGLDEKEDRERIQEAVEALVRTNESDER